MSEFSIPGRQRLPRAQRMEQMLDAAHYLFSQRGFTAVTMDDIAAAVGVTKPLLYTYFGNKERLYIACLEQSADTLVRTIVDAVAAADVPADALGDGIRAFFEFIAADPSAWAVLFDESLPGSGDVADRIAQYRDQILEAVAGAALAQMGTDARDNVRVETEMLATAILGATEATTRWWLRERPFSHRYAAELLIGTIEPGLRQITNLPTKSGETTT